MLVWGDCHVSGGSSEVLTTTGRCSGQKNLDFGEERLMNFNKLIIQQTNLLELDSRLMSIGLTYKIPPPIKKNPNK